jgi:hypothetical protein
MGREATCVAKSGGKSGEGKALLESDELIFRGEFRMRVPLREITTVSSRNGSLTVKWPGGKLALILGKDADKWAHAITNPKGLMEKMGVKPGLQVAIVGRFETSFRTEIMNALGVKPGVKPVPGCDLVFYLVVHENDPEKFKELIPAIAPDGGIWAVYPRGRKDVSEDTIRSAARGAGLVDIKIVRVSDTHGAVKLVIPKADRAGKRG